MSDTGNSDDTQDSGVYDPNTPISVLGNAAMPPKWSVGGDPSQPSILGPALNPPPWTPADNSLNFFVDQPTMKTIDLSGLDVPPSLPSDGDTTDGGQPHQPDDGGFYTGLTPYQPGADAGSSVLNSHGYIPQSGDGNQLGRIIYAEASNTPSDMPAIGWSVVNRVGDPEFGKTMDDVINQKNQFSSVQGNSKQWQGSADPDSLTGPNAAAWQKAQNTAQGILGGAIPDPVDGGTYFFSSSSYNNGQGNAPGGFQKMLANNRIVPVNPPGGGGTDNYFFKRNPSPPGK
jgi:hypothetical protein